MLHIIFEGVDNNDDSDSYMTQEKGHNPHLDRFPASLAFTVKSRLEFFGGDIEARFTHQESTSSTVEQTQENIFLSMDALPRQQWNKYNCGNLVDGEGKEGERDLN